MNISFTNFILVLLLSKMSTRRFIVVILLTVVPCMAVLTVETVTETIPALDFIQKLIVHIPEKHFKMLRYYGIYAKHHKQEMKLRKCISAEKQCFLHFYTGIKLLLSLGHLCVFSHTIPSFGI